MVHEGGSKKLKTFCFERFWGKLMRDVVFSSHLWIMGWGREGEGGRESDRGERGLDADGR